MAARRRVKTVILYAFLILVGLALIYPLVWMFFATFKTNAEIFGSTRLLPQRFSFEAYIEGWNTAGGAYKMSLFMGNTFKLVIPTVLATVVSSVLVGYGFSRFRFPLKKLLFTLMLTTLMLPNTVIMIPRYLTFNELGWLNSYLPFYVPALLGGSSFLIYMMMQFMRGIPLELDESAKIDGCNSFMILVRVIAPLSKPAIISVVIFQTLWAWNDFFNPLIYLNSTKLFPVSLGLRLMLDSSGLNRWDHIMAMSLLAILPCLLLFAVAQKHFVEGISTTGLKG